MEMYREHHAEIADKDRTRLARSTEQTFFAIALHCPLIVEPRMLQCNKTLLLCITIMFSIIID